MFGQPHFATQNARLNATLTSVGTLIVAHRAVGHGSIAENTTLAVRAAQLSGADMVEIDVTASSDGEFYSFHDGHEPETLGFKANLQTLTAAEIDQVSFIWVDRPGRRARVERLLPLLESFRGGPMLFTVDRSWWRWPALLRSLARLDMSDQLVMKCPAWEDAALHRLREFPVKFPVMPICAGPDDVYRTLDDPDLNTVGVELITTTRHHPWFSHSVMEEFHGRGVFCFVNTETLTTGVPLFGGLDDELAITSSPEAAYGPIFDLGVDAIQTDWPWLVRDYRTSWYRDYPELLPGPR
ncbi:MAG: glycerophosphodiester phosphodiesterase family protein [Propionicimonas sp.]